MIDKSGLKTLAAAERTVITNELFHTHVAAKALRPVVTPSFIMYPLALDVGERIGRVRGALENLALRMTEKRLKHYRNAPIFRGNPEALTAKIRLHSPPLYIEANSPVVRPLPWNGAAAGSGNMHFGMIYGHSMAHALTVNMDETPHILVAGATGAGKSNAVVVGVLSMAAGMAPSELEIRIVDLSNDVIADMADLPHCTQLATNGDDATALVRGVYQELLRRRDARTRSSGKRLLLVIDELADLTKSGRAFLAKIASMGRKDRVNSIVAIQHPRAELLGGGEGKANFVGRLAGFVVDATAAHMATGRRESGAEKLPGSGAFLWASKNRMDRVQVAYVADPEREIRRIGSSYGGHRREVPEVRREAPEVRREVVREAPEAPGCPVSDALADLFAKRVRNGRLEGGVMAALRILYGKDAAKSGRRFQMQRERLNGELERWNEWRIQNAETT